MRLEHGLSQERLANDAQVDRSYMGGIERGEHNPTLMTIIRVASCLGARPSDIFTRAGL